MTPPRPTAHGAPDAAAFRDVMARCPSTVAVVGTLAGGRPVGCVVSSFLSLSVEPPALTVSLTTAGHLLGDVVAARRFTVCVLAADQHALVRTFSCGDRTRRYDAVDHVVTEYGPLLASAFARLACRVVTTVPALDHTLVVGAVEALGRTDGDALLLDRGNPRVARPTAGVPVARAS